MNTNILSIQLYTLRSLGELDRVLDIVKQACYGHVETIGSHLDDAENVRAKLDARDLKVSSSHVSLAALRKRLDVVVQACHTLGFEQLFMPAVPPEQRQVVGLRARPLHAGGKKRSQFERHCSARKGGEQGLHLPGPPIGWPNLSL